MGSRRLGGGSPGPVFHWGQYGRLDTFVRAVGGRMARLFALIVSALLAPLSAFAVDCPVDGNGEVLPGWPLDKSPSGLVSATSGVVNCPGGTVNATATGIGTAYRQSFQSVRARLAENLASQQQEPYETYMSSVSLNGGYAYVALCWRATDGTPGWKGENQRQVVTNDACTPPPPNCQQKFYSYEIRAATPDSAKASAGECIDSCKVDTVSLAGPGINKDAAGTFNYTVIAKIKAEQCNTLPDPVADPSPLTEDAPDPSANEYCVTTSAGNTVCGGPQGENCGYVNNNFVCLGKTDPDECWRNTDGSTICGEKAPTPPVPDSGTRGQKATPQDQVQAKSPDGTTNTYNYYNSTTVNNSSVQSTSGANPNRSTSTDPSKEATPTVEQGGGGGTGEGGGESSAGGGETCEAPPTCSGDAVQCAQLVQSWRIRCPQSLTAAELLEGIQATPAEKGEEAGPNDGQFDGFESFDSSPFLGGGGSCPNFGSVVVMGQSLDFSAMWDGACQMAVLFAPIVQAMGYLFAALILFRTNWG